MQGAIVTFTKGLSHQLIGKGIRVNCIAPGPVWTPLIPMSFDENTVGLSFSISLLYLSGFGCIFWCRSKFVLLIYTYLIGEAWHLACKLVSAPNLIAFGW